MNQLNQSIAPQRLEDRRDRNHGLRITRNRRKLNEGMNQLNQSIAPQRLEDRRDRNHGLRNARNRRKLNEGMNQLNQSIAPQRFGERRDRSLESYPHGLKRGLIRFRELCCVSKLSYWQRNGEPRNANPLKPIRFMLSQKSKSVHSLAEIKNAATSMTILVGWRFEKVSNANEGNVRELSRIGGGEGTLDFAAEGRRGRASREFVLIRAAHDIRGSILPESLTMDHTNLHGCLRLKSASVSMTKFK